MMIYPEADFARATPESQGISSSAIQAMLSDIRACGADIHSLLIMRRGHLVFEQYFAPYTADTPHAMYSCSKTFTSALIGIAQDKGLLSVHDKVLSFFPDVPVDHVSDNLAAMTIEHLLMMGTGHGQDTLPYLVQAMESEQDPDFVRVFLNRPVDHQPGTHFVYNTGATYMLSAILTKVTGRTALDLANEWLFGPMGITNAVWDTCPRGISLGGMGLHLTPRDMLRMGMLLLSHGRWKDQQLVSPAYIAAATTKHIENRSGDPAQDPNWAAGYCYQIWRNAFGGFRADGMGGQYIAVLPREEMIIVFTSSLGGDKSIGYDLDLIAEKLLPGTHCLPQVHSVDDAASLAQLSQQISAPAATDAPVQASWLTGHTITFGQNDAHIGQIGANGSTLWLTYNGQRLEAPYHWGAPAVGAEWVSIPPCGLWPNQVQLCGRADATDSTITLRLGLVGEPLTWRIAMTCDGNHVQAHVVNTMLGVHDITGTLS